MASRSLSEAQRLNALTGAARAADDRPKPTLAERRARLRGRMDPMAMMMEKEE
jgi:hypothetical protein